MRPNSEGFTLGDEENHGGTEHEETERTEMSGNMSRTTILILEDNPDRLREFETAVVQLGPSYRLRAWRDAHRMIAECHEALVDAALISLDHDLNKENDHSPDPGDGVQVAAFLARLPQICPVILHTSNGERVWSMHNEFRFGVLDVRTCHAAGE
jgi:CheY-like chemotaxis protein